MLIPTKFRLSRNECDGVAVAPWRDPTGAMVWRWGEAGKAAGREELPLSKRYILEYDLIRGCFLSL